LNPPRRCHADDGFFDGGSRSDILAMVTSRGGFMSDGVRGAGARRHGFAAVLVFLAGLAGCAADHRPTYAMPKKPLGEVAVVVGTYNVLSSFEVNEVDGARVKVPPFSVNYPVKVLPGQRQLTVTGAAGNGRATWRFAYDFVAGHRYTLSASSAVTQGGLKITDKTTNTSTIIH
jgi:hypothetical protein